MDAVCELIWKIEIDVYLVGHSLMFNVKGELGRKRFFLGMEKCKLKKCIEYPQRIVREIIKLILH